MEHHLIMAKGYIIAELQAVNRGPDFMQYRDEVAATVEAYDGRFLVRDRDATLLEGEAPAGIMVVLEFPSPERAMQWYRSDAYQKILPLRLNNSTTRLHHALGT